LKFQPDHLSGTNSITHHDGDGLRVNGVAFAHSVLVPWTGPVRPWPARTPLELTPTHFESVLELEPEVVIFGSGERIRFVSPALYRALIERRIGLETMDTAAACRTYNVLAAEGRRVVAAVLLGLAATPA